MNEGIYEFKVTVDFRTSHIAILRDGRTTNSMAFTPAGVELVMALMEYIRLNHGIRISRFNAEHLLSKLNSTAKTQSEFVEVKGQDSIDGGFRKVALSFLEIQSAVEAIISNIVGTVKSNLEIMISVELHPLLSQQGISLDGEFRHLSLLSDKLRDELHFAIYVEP